MAVIDGKITPEVAKLWHKYYPEYTANTFGTLVESYTSATSHVLEIGAGSGIGHQHYFNIKGNVEKYVGIDLDERVLKNPHLDEAFVCDAEALPFSDASFDVVFHTMVAEHLQNPLAAMREAARVLKPGGTLLFETPNQFYYPMLVSSVTPQWFHELYVNRLGSGRQTYDVFPTVYRLNDRKSIMSCTRAAGLEPEISFQSMPPGYLRFSQVSFLLGILYERTVERVFPHLRARIIVVATKPG